MNKNKIISCSPLSLFIFLVSICSSQNIKEQILTVYADGAKKEVLKIFKSEDYDIKLERIIYSNPGYPIFVESFFNNRTVEREYHENGELKKELNYQDKVLDGEVIEFFNNGQLKCRFLYKKGEIKPGEYNSYYKNGFIEDTYIFGDIVEYHDKDTFKFKALAIDTITYDHSFKYNKFLKSLIDTTDLGIKYKGDYEKYHKNGRLKLFIENINWNDDNTINMDNVRILNKKGNLIYNFKIYKNFYHDKYLSYFNNGKLKLSGQYKIGNKVGLWVEYDKEGTVILEENWKNGKKIY